MDRKKNLRLVCSCCLVLIVAVLVGISPVRATQREDPPLDAEWWLSFDGRSGPDVPELSLLASSAGAIELQAGLPGCQVGAVMIGDQHYSRLFGQGYGHGTLYGRPDLPVLRKGVEIPFAAEVSLELLAADYTDYTLEELGLAPLYPLQPPLPKLPGARERAPFVLDESWYTGGGVYPAAPLALGEPYVVRGHRVQPLEAWPVAYDAAAGTVRLYSRIEFRLVLQGSDMARTEALAGRYASPAFEVRLAGQVLNYNQGRGSLGFAPDADVGYLIITVDAFYDAMLPFVQLRESRGFEVTMTRLSDVPGGGSNADILAYIQQAYDTWPTPPSYVLLVGDTDTIPGWPSVSAGEITDLYYATMDGSGDWHPDIGRGRFPVRTPAQATAMVDKYLAYANFTGDEPWLKKAAFIASCDDWQTAEGTHNYVIGNHTLPNGYTGIFPNDPEPGGDKIYCVTYGGSATNITNAAEDGRWAIVYSGHGYTGGWGDGAVSYSQGDVQNLQDYGFYPFVGSHACNTGDFDVIEAYCETWVLQEGKGALVFWGSSDSSYWDEDDILERSMFDSLFANVGLRQNQHADVTEMTYYGLAETEAMYPGSARYYWETYNVMGDPAVRIFLEPDLPSFSLEVEPEAHELCGSGVLTSSVRVGVFLGYSETVYLEAGPLPVEMSATLVPTSSLAPYTATLTLEVAPGTPTGDYTVVITASDQISWTHDAQVDLRVVDAAPDVPALLAPPDGALDQDFVPTLEWGEVAFASAYDLQLDRSPLFGAPLVDRTGLAGTDYTLETALEGGRCYWWHARGDNACGEGTWAEPFHFATMALEVGFYDNMESGDGNWTHQAAQGSDNWALAEDQSHSPTHAWHVPDDPNVTDTRLWNALPVPVGAGSSLSFWHRHQFEGSYDGAVLEISANAGTTWTDLGPYITANGYNGTISTCCSNPLGGRQAWVSDLNEWTRVEVDLGSFAGEDVQVRWRLGCDYSVPDVGWYIDDVQITAPLPPNPAPTLLGITPDSGTPYMEIPVLIEGSGLLDTPSVRLGQTWLLSATLVSSTTLEAVVPAGMAPGVYTLTLYNGDCQEAVLPEAFTVIGRCISPTVQIASDSPVELGRPMHFTATLLTGTLPLTYTWDLGDGIGGSSAANPAYTYTAAGLYTVTLTVANACGADAVSATVEVLEPCLPPEVEVSAAGPVELGRALAFTATVLSGTGPLTYVWDVGGAGVGEGLDTAAPVFTYTEVGTFTVWVTVTGACGSDGASTVVEVYCIEPAATMTCDSPVLLGQPMHFTATLVGTGPLTCSWDFGDGVGGSAETHPAYAYAAAGTYTVTLTVQGPCGEDVAVGTVKVAPMYRFYLPLTVKGSIP